MKRYKKDNISEIDNNRRQVKMLFLVILLVSVVLVGSSYAWFTATETGKNVTVSAGTLNISFSDSGSDITLQDQVPITTSEALKTDGYTFTVTNNGTIDADYTVILDDVELSTGETRLDNKYVRYSLEKDGVEVANNLISNLVDNKIVISTLKPKASAEYTLRVYLDEDKFDTDAVNKVFKKTIKVESSQHTEKSNTLVCMLKQGLDMKIGSLYECDPGDGTVRSFYALEVRDNEVDLLMDRNISQGTSKTTMSYTDALSYMTNEGYTNSWKNVLKVDLPGAQQIANAVGYTTFDVSTASGFSWCFASHVEDYTEAPYCDTNAAKTYNYLYDYTRQCNGCSHSLDVDEAYGYWTKDKVFGSETKSWVVDRWGSVGYTDAATSRGVRPTITVSKDRMGI